MNSKMEKASPVYSRTIEGGVKHLENCEKEPKTIPEIAKICNVTVGYFRRSFKNYAGISPGEYRDIQRVNRIKMYLHRPEVTLEQIAEYMHFCDSGYLCRFFKRKTGMTPHYYRRFYLLQARQGVDKI